MPVRMAMCVRTVFNILGPLTNPAAPPFNVIGAFSVEVAHLMAQALAGLDIRRAFVVHGEPGWDEATPAGAFHLFDVTPGKVRREIRTPEDYGVARCDPADLAGGDAAMNAAALTAVFDGRDPGPHRDALLMGASLALEVSGLVDGPLDGVARSRSAIDDGSAARLLRALGAFSA